MAYPDRWSFGLSAMEGERVPLSEELVPTRANGRVLPRGDAALINLDINYNNGKQSSSQNGKYMLKNPSYDRRL